MAEAVAEATPVPWRDSESEEENTLYQKCRCCALWHSEIDMGSISFDSTKAEAQFRNEWFKEHMLSVRKEIEHKRSLQAKKAERELKEDHERAKRER